jgi:hypothetical protein
VFTLLNPLRGSKTGGFCCPPVLPAAIHIEAHRASHALVNDIEVSPGFNPSGLSGSIHYYAGGLEGGYNLLLSMIAGFFIARFLCFLMKRIIFTFSKSIIYPYRKFYE